MLVAVLSLVLSAFSGHEIIGAIVVLIFYLGGVGVREHSRYAAAVLLLLYIVDSVASPPSVLRLGIAAVLFSNLRATWVASRWSPDSSEGVGPPRFAESWADKFADTLPPWLWPKVKIPFYVFSTGFLMLEIAGGVMLLRHRL